MERLPQVEKLKARLAQGRKLSIPAQILRTPGRVRFWLIRKLVGNSTVLANCKMKGPVGPPGSNVEFNSNEVLIFDTIVDCNDDSAK